RIDFCHGCDCITSLLLERFQFHFAEHFLRWRFQSGNQSAPETESIENMAQENEQHNSRQPNPSAARQQHARLHQNGKAIKKQWNEEQSWQKSNNQQINAKKRRNKIQCGAWSWMRAKLFGSPAPVIQKHFYECSPTGTRTAIDQQLGIVNQCSPAL